MGPSTGDGCGACDVVLCRTCLAGTGRCPSCQRPFGATRGAPSALPPGARRPSGLPAPLIAAIIAVFITAAFAAYKHVQREQARERAQDVLILGSMPDPPNPRR